MFAAATGAAVALAHLLGPVEPEALVEGVPPGEGPPQAVGPTRETRPAAIAATRLRRVMATEARSWRAYRMLTETDDRIAVAGMDEPVPGALCGVAGKIGAALRDP